LKFGYFRTKLFWIVCIFVLSGCVNQKDAAEEMYEVLENVVNLEKEFEEQQEPLVSLEKQEKDLYNQIMAIGMKNHAEITKLSDEALTLVEERRKHLQAEVESLRSAEEEFKKIANIKEEISNNEQKQLADELYDLMIQRYKVHSELADKYLEALDKDQELYLMFKKEELSYEQLETLISDLNQLYAKISDTNEGFNQYTTEYNDKKIAFYKKAGFKIEKK
jgi:chromosome segregation ATPase